MRVAHVIVDIPVRSIDRTFDYAVPNGLAASAICGVPVLVPFGGRDAVGYVVGLSQCTTTELDLKEVSAVLGDPLFAPHAPEVAQWIADEYVSGLADAMSLFLPPGGTPRVRRVDGCYELIRPDVGPVDDRWVVPVDCADPSGIRAGATRQRAVFDAVTRGPVRMAELRAGLGDIGSAASRLEELGLVQIVRKRRYRTPGGRPSAMKAPFDLTTGQLEALDAIGRAGPGETVLLHGVTGSGKTEVYLQAIEGIVADGSSAIVLVPEISLTPQTVGRFRARFGQQVAVLHSRLSKGERFDQWDLARRGDVSVVVGPRSALFAPLHDVGLVVMDEEHETSYKQGSTPRYHARDVARVLCRVTGARLVLGSATPSLESLDFSERGLAVRIPMPERATGAPMPEVDVVDMTGEFTEGNRSMFSRQLADALAAVQARKEKALLFLNRRGFASFLLCRECGYVPECDSCAVSLTYHRTGNRLACHHCSAVRAVPSSCPKCGSPYLRLFGAGTQRVETELRNTIPGFPVVRMDADTTSGKGGHEARLAEFEEFEAGILLGTQMVAKGLDYPEVTLVGVLDADTSLRLPDFRAGERTYQLLEQVAGRAGRGDLPGKVIIQTYWPEHHSVRAVASHSDRLFYESETDTRRELNYPPYGRLANIRVTGRSADEVRAGAEQAAAAIRARAGDDVKVLGPAPAPIARIRDSYRWRVTVKAPVDAPLSALVRDSLGKVRLARGVAIAPDIDPFDML